MELQLSALAAVVRSDLINLDGVTRFTPNRRFATVYSEGSPADTIFFVESGMVKIYKRGPDNKEIIIQIVAAGELFGEQALGTEPSRSIAAEVLQEGMRKAFKDPAFLEAYRKATGEDATPVMPEDLQRIVKEVPRDPEIVSLFNRIAGPESLPDR